MDRRSRDKQRVLGLRIPAAAQRFPWVSTLLSNAIALTETEPDVLSAISFTAEAVSAGNAEAETFRHLSEHLAAEFGLTASVWVEGCSLNVRLAHPTAARLENPVVDTARNAPGRRG